MKLTQDDAHVCRVLFNKDTHAMALAMYGDRAKEIYKFVCDTIDINVEFFFQGGIGDRFERILRHESLANFFFGNRLIDFSSLTHDDIRCFFLKSPISDNILTSGVLNSYLHKINGFDIYVILALSPICEKIWNSGKLYLYLHKMDNDNISWLLRESPIADKIKQSGKLKQIRGNE